MALCRVLINHEGWNAGDHVEATGERLVELVDGKIVEIVEPELTGVPVEKEVEPVAEPKVKKSRKATKPKKRFKFI